MALEPKSKTTRSEDGTQAFVEVVEATGVYDAEDNPGGFGAPNPARNEVALVFYGNFKKIAADVAAAPLTYSALTVESFTIPIERATNGHLNFWVFVLDIFDDQAVYADGDIVYDNENPSAPFIKKRVGGVWISIAPEALITETSVPKTEGNVFIIPQAEAYQNELNAEKLKLLQEYVKGEFNEDRYTPKRNDFDYVNSSLIEATNLFCSGSYGEAQKLLEAVLEFEDYRKAS